MKKMRPRPPCKKCGEPAAKNGIDSKTGKQRWKTLCNCCDKKERYPYKLAKKEVCEKCGFVPIHPCQLDVDHIDGDKENMSLDNLMTLCANCHRLKTQMNRDWAKERGPYGGYGGQCSLFDNKKGD